MLAGDIQKLIDVKSSRVTYKPIVLKNGDFFKRIMLDGKDTTFARCIECEKDGKVSIFTMDGNSVTGGAFK